MKLKISLRGLSCIVNAVVLICFAVLVFFLGLGTSGRASYKNPVLFPLFTGEQLSGAALKKPVPGIPIRIKIPTIKVDAFLERVRLTPQGSIGVPKGGVNAAWYELGPRPGKIGNAIIVGHYGTWKNGKGSVFDNLQTLHTGDKVYIEDDKGVSISFVVTRTQRYKANAIVPEVFVSNDGKPHLNIITCEGSWNTITKHYPNRLVVFTDGEVKLTNN